MKFSDKLAKMRKANNLSQEQLADELGVTRQSISKWESGDSYPDMAKIVQLCKVLNCTINDILDDEVVEQDKQSKADEPKDKDASKLNFLKKHFNEFLSFVNKSANMIAHMGARQVIKMFIELMVVGIVCYFLGGLINWGIEEFLWNILSYVPKAYEVVRIIFESVAILAEVFIGVILLVYIFKTRYLDYYVTLTDNNATEQTVEEPIEENKTSELINKKKEKVVIIRDPKHSSSKIIDGLVNIIVFICKVFVVMCAIPVIIGVLGAAAGLVICIVRKGYVFNSSILICLGSLILGVVILMFFYNVIFNRKQLHKLNIILIIVSLLLGGAGCGLLANNITNLTVKEVNSDTKKQTKTIVFDNLKDGDTIYVETFDVEFVIDETKEDITIELEYPEDVTLNENHERFDYGDDYYYGIYSNSLFEFKQFIKDIENNEVRTSYEVDTYLKARVTCNEANKTKIAYYGG